MEIVLVEWNDSASGSSWIRRDIPENIDPVVSVGILIKEDDGQIEIVPNLTKELKLNQIAIPKSTIKRMRRLSL